MDLVEIAVGGSEIHLYDEVTCNALGSLRLPKTASRSPPIATQPSMQHNPGKCLEFLTGMSFLGFVEGLLTIKQPTIMPNGWKLDQSEALFNAMIRI